jgi:hypothetical protein
MTVTTVLGYHQTPYHSVSYHVPFAEGANGAQVESKRTGDQGAQVFFSISGEKHVGVQFNGYSNVGHLTCDDISGYHTLPYHTTSYHNGRTCAGIGAQVQALRVSAQGAQFRAGIYNVDNLRIMCEFPSRGDDGLNWTASSTKPSSTSSFTVNNVNTDVVEQIWRSDDGVKTGITLDCDVGVGKTVFMDTFAMLNHNLTTSATVNLLMSDNPGHAPIGETVVLTMDDANDFVYIKPELPTVGYRYFRLAINDLTNPEDFLSVGTIVFGEAIIFAGECFVDRVRKTPVNFTDSITTEGFTNVQNDRGIKNKVRLEFKNIRFNGPNFEKINEDVFLSARTILKCLWVPTPQFPLRFTTFAKMTKIPEQTHNVKGEDLDYIDFVIETDESK